MLEDGQRQLVTIRTVKSIIPIVDALNIELSIIDGWQVVVKKDSLKHGSKCVYFEIDSLIPISEPQFSFLNCTHTVDGIQYHRLKTVKMRKQLSQGLAIPLSEFDDVDDDVLLTRLRNITKKWEPEEKTHLKGLVKGNFPFFIPKSEQPRIQNMSNFFMAFKTTDYEISEKIDGCVDRITKIKLPDGSFKFVNNIKVGEYVMGVNPKGDIIPTKVLATHNNGPNKEPWFWLRGTKRCIGTGDHTISIRTTGNHCFYCPEKKDYVPINELKSGDTISVITNQIYLSSFQKEILNGCMLGDGSLSMFNSSAKITFSHKKDHEEYINWLLKSLGTLSSTKSESISGFGTPMVIGKTIHNYFIKEEYSKWIKNGKKIIPIDIKLTPMSMSIWYMDDGHLEHTNGQRDRITISTCGFSKEDCQILINALNVFNIVAKMVFRKYWYISMIAVEADKFFRLIYPYVTSCMQYKLPKQYRGNLINVPVDDFDSVNIITTQTIGSIKQIYRVPTSNKYDITTETGNYIANGILIHNSSITIYYNKGASGICSRNLELKKEDESTYSKCGNPILDKIEQYCIKNNKNLAFQGEMWGKGVTKNSYGSDIIQISIYNIFDINKNTYLSSIERLDIIKEIGLVSVPILANQYKIFNTFTTMEALIKHADGRSKIGDCKREGIVCKASNGSHSFKVISNEYLLKVDS